VASSPDALSAFQGKLIALLSDGIVETSSDAGATWSTIAKPGTIAASPAAKGCGGSVKVTAVAFGMLAGEVLAGGTCGAGGTGAVFSYTPGNGWQRMSLPESGRLIQLVSGMALMQGKAGLSALWRGFSSAVSVGPAPPTLPPAPASPPTGWMASRALPVSGTISASGMLSPAAAWVLLSGGRAATVGLAAAGPARWLLLPAVPAHTSVLAAGPSGAVDALAVSGTTLTVWRLVPKAATWSKVQAISVPVQSGSSS
jgi:hypothetical protein